MTRTVILVLGVLALVACNSAGPARKTVRNVTVGYDCSGCDRQYAITLLPSNSFTFVRPRRQELVQGRVNFDRYATMLLETTFFRRLRESAWLTLGSGDGQSSLVITSDACDLPTCAYGTNQKLYRIQFDPKVAPDLAAYVKSVYATVAPAVVDYEDALHRRLVRFRSLRSIELDESTFRRCTQLRATFQTSNLAEGSYVAPSGSSARFAASVSFSKVTQLLAQSHPELFVRSYGRSEPLGLRLMLQYADYIYGAVAPDVEYAPPDLAHFVETLDNILAPHVACG